ncbi:hypothetical protein Q4S33_14420 [Acinetobacter calcoaceticus]|nr:hypothetical protein Q4S33_14420 [Acinetobacter calcoaceticus]
MNKSVRLFYRSTLSLAIFAVATSSYAEVTQEQIAKLQQQIQELQTRFDKQNEDKKVVAMSTSSSDLKRLVTKGGQSLNCMEIFGQMLHIK